MAFNEPAHPPAVIAHRGASGYRPEHTAAAFELAINQGADALETDLVPTRDGVLICRHDAELSLTTDVASRVEFFGRRTSKTIDGALVIGWFVEDFTWDEISTLRARERWPFRDHQFDGQYGIMSLPDLLELARDAGAKRGRPIDVLLEIKHPTYFASVGIAVETPLLKTLEQFGYTHADSSVIVESFEVSILRRLREQTGVRFAQLIEDANTRPFDFTAVADPRTYGDLIAPTGLEAIKKYAGTIGVWKRLIMPALARDANNLSNAPLELAAPTVLISDAHAAGLEVHAWTFRGEQQFLAADYSGQASREYEQFLRLGLDGFITDFPDEALAALPAGRRSR